MKKLLMRVYFSDEADPFITGSTFAIISLAIAYIVKYLIY